MLMPRKSILLLLLTFCMPGGSVAVGIGTGQPFQVLEAQISDLTERLEALEARLSPPTIAYDLTCESTSTLRIDFYITDDEEVSFYVIQESTQAGVVTLMTFADLGIAAVEYPFTLDPGPGTRTILLVASDVDGNTNKEMVEVAPDICFEPCPPGVICP